MRIVEFFKIFVAECECLCRRAFKRVGRKPDHNPHNRADNHNADDTEQCNQLTAFFAVRIFWRQVIFRRNKGAAVVLRRNERRNGRWCAACFLRCIGHRRLHICRILLIWLLYRRDKSRLIRLIHRHRALVAARIHRWDIVKQHCALVTARIHRRDVIKQHSALVPARIRRRDVIKQHRALVTAHIHRRNIVKQHRALVTARIHRRHIIKQHRALVTARIHRWNIVKQHRALVAARIHRRHVIKQNRALVTARIHRRHVIM